MNDGISKELASMHYASMDDAVNTIRRLGRGTLLAKLDLKSAYRKIPVYFKNVEANREASKSSLDNTFKSPTRLLAKFFKKPSEMAKKHSKARLLYDDMMHRAERKLVEMERATADLLM